MSLLFVVSSIGFMSLFLVVMVVLGVVFGIVCCPHMLLRLFHAAVTCHGVRALDISAVG